MIRPDFPAPTADTRLHLLSNGWTLYRCRRRMEELGFDRNGAIYRSIDQAYSAFLELNAELFCQAHGFPAAKPQPAPRAVRLARRRDYERRPCGTCNC